MIDDYSEFLRTAAFKKGVSGYSDWCQDGWETIGEAFAKHRDGMLLSPWEKFLVSGFIEVHRK